MPHRRQFVLLLLCLLCLSTSAFGATYYVATNGSDSNPGTSGSPWRTLQKAVDTINPGDTAYVRSGTYVGCKVTRSGSSGAVCTLAEDAGASVVINAPGPNNTRSSGIEVEGGSTLRYWVFSGFEITGTGRCGFDIRDTEYITIRNNYVHNTGGGGVGTGIFLAFCYYLTSEDNESAYSGEHGTYQSNSGDYYTGRRNHLHHNTYAGQHMNGDESMGGDGLISYAVIEQCSIHDDGGSAAINCDGVTDSIFRNNVIYNEAGAGVTLFQCDGALASSNNKIYNNTFYFPSTSAGRDIIYGCNGTGNQVYNNILYTARTSKSAICIDRAAEFSVCDYNAVADRFSANNGSTIITLAQWQSQTGFDSHSFLSTPSALFVNPATFDLHLKVGSPAINTGKTLAEVTNDRDGNSRPQGGAYDIGAYEYLSGGGSPPVANFTGNPTSGTSPLTVAFTDSSTNTPTSWSWNFGDGSTSTSQNPSHTYSSAGTRTVSLRATNASGYDDEVKTNYITVNPPAPVANFTGNPTSGTAPLTVAFTDTSTNAPTSWSWNFGDSTTSTSQNPSHTYTSTGTRTVSLRATNAAGYDDEVKTNYITVGAPPPAPVASFSGTPTTGTAPLAVAFTDSSTNSPTSWSWNFGDSSTSTAQNPSHTFSAAGSYTVSLRATNASGYDDEIKTNYITASSGGGGSMPTFVAAGTIASGTGAITPALPAGIAVNDILLLLLETANQAISISNQNGGTWAEVSGSPQGTGTAGGTAATRLTVFWSRYNGSQGAPTTSDSGDHQMGRILAFRGCATSGNPWDVYAGGVEATVDTSGRIPGTTNTVTNVLVVAAIATALPDASGTASFSSWTNANLSNLTERTDNTVADGNGGGIGVATGGKATANDFSYGNTSVTCGTAAAKGLLSLALKPGGGGGSAPVSAFSGTPTSGTAPLSVTFTDSSTNSPTSWSWNFGDSSTSTSQNPSHSYAAGTYTVSLRATNSYGYDDEVKTNYITASSGGSAPVANFTGSPTTGVAPLAVAFTDTSTNSPTSWSWSFGDGSTSTSQNPSHTYNSFGKYTVSLTATNAYGSDGETKTNYLAVSKHVGATSYTLLCGTLISGTVTNVQTSDNTYLQLRAPANGYAGGQFTFATGLTPSQVTNITYEVEKHTSRADATAKMDLTLRIAPGWTTFNDVWSAAAFGTSDSWIPAYSTTAVSTYMDSSGNLRLDFGGGCTPAQTTTWDLYLDTVRVKLDP